MTADNIARAREALRVKREKQSRTKAKQPHLRRSGVPPHPDFDLAKLPPSTLLTLYEVAQVKRCAVGTVRKNRRDPAHDLKWVEVDGRPRCRAGDLREHLAQGTKAR